MIQMMALLAWLGTAAVADPASAAVGSPAAEARPVRPARPGDRGVFRLSDGGTIYGTLLSSGPDGAVVELTSGAQVRFAPGRLVGLEAADDAPPAAADPREVRVYLWDGQVLRGRLVDEGPPLRLTLADGTERAVAPEQIRQVTGATSPAATSIGWGDPARQRYGATPSAFLLPARAWQLSLQSGTVPALAYGATPWLTVSVSSPLPVLEASGFGAAGAVTATAGWPAGRLVHLAGGLRVRTTFSGDGASSLAAFATATVGTADANATLHLGPPPLRPFRGEPLGEPAGSIAGSLRAGPLFRFIGEVWIADGTAPGAGPAARTSLAVRTTWRGLAVDLGLTAGRPSQVAAWFAVSHTWEARP